MAFKINGSIALDGAQFKHGLQEAGGEAAAFIRNFALGAVGIASVEQAFSKTIDSAEELVNTSKNLDMTVEQLQLMRQAAEENGQGFDTMTKALEKFNAVRESILTGQDKSGKQMAAMQRLGLTHDTLESQTAAQSMMGQISQTAQKSNAADIAQDLREVFGKGGDEIFGTLKTNFEELETKMKSYGAIMDTTTAVELKTFKEEMGLISQVFAAQFSPVILMFAHLLFEANAAIGSFGASLGTWAGVIADLILHPIDFWKKGNNIKSLLGAGETADAGNDFWKGKQDQWKAIEQHAKDIADRLNNPKPPAVIDQEENQKKKHAVKEKEIKSDSLISVGNFLGAGRSAIGDVAAQHLEVSKKQLTVLEKIESKIISGGIGFMGSIDFEN